MQQNFDCENFKGIRQTEADKFFKILGFFNKLHETWNSIAFSVMFRNIKIEFRDFHVIAHNLKSCIFETLKGSLFSVKLKPMNSWKKTRSFKESRAIFKTTCIFVVWYIKNRVNQVAERTINVK